MIEHVSENNDETVTDGVSMSTPKVPKPSAFFTDQSQRLKDGCIILGDDDDDGESSKRYVTRYRYSN